MASRGCGCGLDTGLVKVPAYCSLRTVEDAAAFEAEVNEVAGHRGGVEQRVWSEGYTDAELQHVFTV